MKSVILRCPNCGNTYDFERNAEVLAGQDDEIVKIGRYRRPGPPIDFVKYSPYPQPSRHQKGRLDEVIQSLRAGHERYWRCAKCRSIQNYPDIFFKSISEVITFSTSPLQVVDSLPIYHVRDHSVSHIELCVGNLVTLPKEDAVDILIISAFPNDYTPSPSSVIGELHQQGVSVAELAKHKVIDLRGAFSCWLSSPISTSHPNLNFRQILCFEPYIHGKPAELVGDIFRSLAPFVGGDFPIRTVATPLVSTGYQGSNPEEIICLLVEAAVQWISIGLPIQCFKIGILPGKDTEALCLKFGELKLKYSNMSSNYDRQFYRYHVFISYSHVNVKEADWFESKLSHKCKDIRVFMDRRELDPGASWQYKIFEALDDCREVLALLSPDYLSSKVCLEEFNIGLYRHRETPKGILYPVYLYSTSLPTYMKLVQFRDCREFNKTACSQVVDELIVNAFT